MVPLVHTNGVALSQRRPKKNLRVPSSRCVHTLQVPLVKGGRLTLISDSWYTVDTGPDRTIDTCWMAALTVKAIVKNEIRVLN